jgi:hypothetical protein
MAAKSYRRRTAEPRNQPGRVNLTNDKQRWNLTRLWGISDEDLEEAVKTVGTDVEAVRVHISRWKQAAPRED